MKSQIFKFGGGAGIGSYVIVWENGQLVNPQAEKIRGAYDNGDNLYLSIIDDGTEEALLSLSGYVDNEGILHLSGRDFDDNKTYEFEINGNTHEITSSEVEGITMGEGTIPSDVPGSQATATLVKDALTNLNGRVLSAYEATDGLYADLYPIKTITYGGETCTEEQARNYMEYMTGSRFLPVYNYEKPQNSMWIMSDGTFWKPQFDENNGLILFQIPSLFALKSETGTKLYKHEITFLGTSERACVATIVTTSNQNLLNEADLYSGNSQQIDCSFNGVLSIGVETEENGTYPMCPYLSVSAEETQVSTWTVYVVWLDIGDGSNPQYEFDVMEGLDYPFTETITAL